MAARRAAGEISKVLVGGGLGGGGLGGGASFTTVIGALIELAVTVKSACPSSAATKFVASSVTSFVSTTARLANEDVSTLKSTWTAFVAVNFRRL